MSMAKYRVRAWSIHTFMSKPPSLNRHMLPEATSLHKHDCLNHCLFAIDSTLSPPPLIGSSGNLPPFIGALQKSPHK